MDIVDFIKARLDEEEAGLSVMFHRDPQRVRRQIEAFRGILEAHGSWPVIMTEPMEIETGLQDPDSITLKASQRVVVFAARQYADHTGQAPTTPMLRAIAYIWRDHPDFEKAWTP